MRGFWLAGFLAVCLLLPVPSLEGKRQSVSNERITNSASTSLQKNKLFNAASLHWHWVYEGIAHGQSFLAEGNAVQALQLRVARLNHRTPAAPLKVEIRDRELRTLYLTGEIHPQEADQKFRWAGVEIEYSVPLEQGQSYVLLIYSSSTQHDSPWLVNATHADPYPDGKHLGYPDDLFFSLQFDNVTTLRVGPPQVSLPELPHNSGRPGGIPVLTPPTLRFPGRIRPDFAVHDPLGPIPEANKVKVMMQMSP